ncbi:MAG: hypothetical protein J6033_05255 [Lachnospiraceae bacterium]|nr:hypothetical protein [Lachnospiraceae bacterium]
MFFLEFNCTKLIVLAGPRSYNFNRQLFKIWINM